MKVQGPHRPIAVDQVRDSKGPQAAKAEGSSRSQGEQVRVSSEAIALHDARSPEVPDQDRIARLKEAIVNGTFRIDSNRIAEAMLREEF